ncbi:MAG TPA: hypothetical protein DCO83_09725, partial [Mucilaginibacter sp.]|nr:hypothetical protein [Mucilaginibacter sp.]
MDNEGGFYSEIISYKIGYWLWLASSLTMLIGNTITYFSKPAQLSVSLGRDKDKLIRKTKPDGRKTSYQA